MIGEKEFNMMRDGTIFINTSRGAVVSESALLDALKSSKIKGAALDVVNGERDGVGTSELVKHSKDSENLIITPHIGGATVEAMATVEQFMVDHLIADIKHEALR
jgi:D-3-phosphoglycerate dehydrogenase